jgi:hypothetical protein
MGSPRDVRLSPYSGGIADIPALRICATSGPKHPQQGVLIEAPLLDHGIAPR